MKKIDILGTEWTIDESKMLNGPCGYCDNTVKTIELCKVGLAQTDFDGAVADVGIVKRETLRHELIHAIGFECGLGSQSFLGEEACVDWIARMFPKLKDIFERAECAE